MEKKKPLSKTKPYTTPFFAYSEVFWSNIIHKYFDNNTPIYRLAICKEYSKFVEKYYDKGTIVPSLLEKGQYLVNLYEYFTNNIDKEVDIKNYINYCMIDYDYTKIFNSRLIKENKEFGESLALQVLISILEANRNFHYENVSFICENERLVKLTPVIDHEFSAMFLFLDDKCWNQGIIDGYLRNFILDIENTNLSIEEKTTTEFFLSTAEIPKELQLLKERYPSVVATFLEKLELFISDLERNSLEFIPSPYIEPFNSESYEIGIDRYKNKNEEHAKELERIITKKHVNLEELSVHVSTNILTIATTLRDNLYQRLEKEKVIQKK